MAAALAELATELATELALLAALVALELALAAALVALEVADAALELPEVLEDSAVEEEGDTEVEVPPVGEAGALAAATPLAAAAKSEMVWPDGGLTTPTMPFWQCLWAEQ